MNPVGTAPFGWTGTAFTGTLLGGLGENFTIQLASPATGQCLQLALGSLASPDTTLNPVLKANRTLSLKSAEVTGDAGEQGAAVHGITRGDEYTQVQTVGVLGSAANYGTGKGATDSPDACAVYGFGRILGSGIGVGIGGFFRGQADSPEGKVTGLQVQTYNNTGVDYSVGATAFSGASIIWMWAAGPNRTGEGVTFANPFGAQCDVGWHFVGQTGASRTDASCETTNGSANVNDASCVAADRGRRVTGTNIPTNAVITSVTPGVSFTFATPTGATATGTGTVSLTLAQVGPTLTADIQSDSNAFTSILIKGAHPTAAIAVAAGSGPAIFGGTTKLIAGSVLEAQCTATADPLVVFGASTAQFITVQLRNGSGVARWFSSGGENGGLTGTVAGDTGYQVSSAGKFYHVGGTVSVIKVGNANTLAFYNATAVTQQKTTGTSGGFTAGSGTGMTSTSTSTGGSGSTAYTFGDLVLALKNYGLLAA